MFPPPPIPTLFPYTTLFRSARAAPRRRARKTDARSGGRTAGVRAGNPGGDTDRKSTRLNSSHVSISYAVFCLKKKKRTGHGGLAGPRPGEDGPPLRADAVGV